MEVTLRKVLKKDWDFILKLRNKKEFRVFFYNKHTIRKKEHYDYLQKQKSNSHFFNWIICYGTKDVGYLRVLDNDVGIIIDSKYQKKGIGAKALQILDKEAKKLGIKKLVGRVMINNDSSKNIFVKNNYNLLMYWFEKDIS